MMAVGGGMGGIYTHSGRQREKASGRRVIDVSAGVCRQVNGVIVEVISVFSR